MPDHSSSIKAIRLFNINETECAFETGSISTQVNMDATYFFAKTVTDAQYTPHPAPRRQYVITLKGKLEFKVTSGETFILEPGIILIAEDTAGPGHSWEIIEGNEWERIYIPLDAETAPNFIAAPQV